MATNISLEETLTGENENTASTSTQSESETYLQPPPGKLEWLFIAVLCSTQFFVQGAFGYILLPLHIVGETFHQGQAEASRMSWHVAGYSLTVGTFILIAGKLGDIYGHREILILGWIWFGVWSVIAGCSAFTESGIFFDIARAFQGIGPAFLLPNALAIAGRTYAPGPKKNMVFSIFACAAPLGCSTAGAIGSAFAQYVWWPWALWMYSIGCFIVAVLGFWLIPKEPQGKSLGKRTQFDWIGAVLGVSGLLLLNISWLQATIDGWPTTYVYVVLIVGLLLLALFVVQEKRASDPLLDISLFNRHVAVVLVTTGLGWSSFGVWFYYLFQFIQNLRHVSPLISAAQFTPGAISGVVAAAATPYLLRKVPSGWLIVIANFAFFTGCVLQATAPVHQSYWFNTFWSFVIMAWGMDISFPASATILSNSVSVKHQGISASLVNTVVNYSIAIGLGIAGSVEQQVGKDGAYLLKGYRSALYTSVGLAGVSFGIATIYAACVSLANNREARRVTGFEKDASV